MSEAGSSERKVSILWAAIQVVVLLVLAVLQSVFALLEVPQFTNQTLRLLFYSIVVVADAVELHIFGQALTRITNVAAYAKDTHSFGIHLCNCDKRRCYKIGKRHLPICARHLGYYGTLVVLAISFLAVPDKWTAFTRYLPPNLFLVIGIVCVLENVVEGGLGKAGIIHQTKNVRFVGGILAALAWIFVAASVFAFFSLPQ